MTAERFYEDSYLQQCEARVLRHDDTGLVVDATVFYPLGGGQPVEIGAVRVVKIDSKGAHHRRVAIAFAEEAA